MDFTLNLNGNMQKQADADASALQKLYDQTRKEEKALALMEKQLKNAGKSGSTNVETGRALSKSIADQKSKISGLTDEMVKLGGAGFEPQIQKTEKLSGKMVAFATAVGTTVANAFVFLGQKAAEAFSSIAKFSEARGDFERGLESIYGSEEAAKHTYDVISTITDRVAVSQEKALTIFDRLEKAGVQNGDQAVKATEAIAKAEAARKGAGDALQGVIERAGKSRMFSINRDELRAAGLTFSELAKNISAKTGQGVKDAELALRFGRVKLADGLDALSATVDKKLGKVADKKFNTLGNQLQRFGDNIGRIFSGADTSKLAAGLGKIVGLFNENSVAGSALKTVIEKSFGIVGDLVEKAAPYVEIFFLGLQLGFLKIYNALYPVRKALKDAFGGDNASALDTFEVIMMGVAGAIGIAARLLADLVLAAGKVVKAFFDIGDSVGDAILKITEGDWVGAGYSIGEGLVKGITGAGGAVIDAVKSLGSSALEAFKGIFQIKSPSRVMMKQGEYINQGLEKGLEKSSGGPERAMAQPPELPAQVSSSNTTVNSGRAVSFSEGSIVINLNGVPSSDQDTIKTTVAQVFIDLFEQLGLNMGAAP
jgi:hypothetical protein